VSRIGVVGGGTMGNGIAHVFAQFGHDTTLVDVTQDALDGARATIEKNLGPVTRGEGTEVASFEEGKQALDDGDEIVYRGAGTAATFTNFGNVFGSVAVTEVSDGAFTDLETIPAEELREFVSEDEY